MIGRTRPAAISSVERLDVVARERLPAEHQAHPPARRGDDERPDDQRVARSRARPRPGSRTRRRAERAPDVQHRVVRIDVDDPVVALAGPRVVDRRVVDHVVGAERADEVQLRRAADAGDLGAVATSRSGRRTARRCPTRRRSGRGRRARTSGRPASAGPGRRGSPHAAASPRPRTTSRPGSARTPAPARRRTRRRRPSRSVNRSAKTRSPGRNRVDVRPDRLDDPRRIEADPRVPRPAQPDEQPDEARLRVEAVEVAAVDRRGADADEDLVAPGLRDRQVAELDHLRAAVAITDGGAHQVWPGSGAVRSGRAPAERDRARGGIRREPRCASGSPRSSPAPGRDPCRSGAGGRP